MGGGQNLLRFASQKQRKNLLKPMLSSPRCDMSNGTFEIKWLCETY